MIIMQENCSKWQYIDTLISWNNQSLELLKKKKKKKKEEISRGVRGHTPPENFESRD